MSSRDSYLTFYPKVAGEVSVTGFKPIYNWLPLRSAPVVEQLWTPNDGCQSNAGQFCPSKESYNNLHYSVSGGSHPAVGYQRIRKANLICSTGTRNSKTGAPHSAVAISNSGTVVNANWITKGKPELWKLLVHLEEYQQTVTKPWQSAVQEFHYGEVLNTLTIPTILNGQTLNVKTFSGLKYSIPVGSVDPHGYLNYSGISTESMNLQRLQYTAGYPSGINL